LTDTEVVNKNRPGSLRQGFIQRVGARTEFNRHSVGNSNPQGKSTINEPVTPRAKHVSILNILATQQRFLEKVKYTRETFGYQGKVNGTIGDEVRHKMQKITPYLSHVDTVRVISAQKRSKYGLKSKVCNSKISHKSMFTSAKGSV
jgi:hypothetical protein